MSLPATLCKHRTGLSATLAATIGIGHTWAMQTKPFSIACERNRDPILAVLREHFADCRHVLEVGSGTGQHAAYFGREMPHLLWQTSDRAENLSDITRWLDEAALPNTPAPLPLDVTAGPWPHDAFDAIFSANTLHIMGWADVQALFAALPTVTSARAKLAIYGPFNYAGKYTSASNATFDQSLRARAPHMGIREFGDVNALAVNAGFTLVDDVAMPANNRTLIWQRA